MVRLYGIALVFLLAFSTAACGDDELPPGHPNHPDNQNGNDNNIEDEIDEDLLDLQDKCEAHCQELYDCAMDDGASEEEAEVEQRFCEIPCNTESISLQTMRNWANAPDLKGIVYDDADKLRECVDARRDYALCTYEQSCGSTDTCDALKTTGEGICESAGIKSN